MYERQIPPTARHDPNAWELLRVWVAERGLHCSMKIGVYEENGPLPEDTAWGVILADVAKHVADALSKEGVRNRDTALSEISRSFAAELQQPTAATGGDFIS